MVSLHDLPFDVIHIIASLLLPYDVLALGATCKMMKPLLTERSVWTRIAESVSRSRPLPFTAAQALDLPVEELISAGLRAERIATRWAASYVIPHRTGVRIRFEDGRIITYFAFLPGSRHLLVHDAHNCLSCWTSNGYMLETWRVPYGAKLSRWKPCDDSEDTYNIQNARTRVIEIMFDVPLSDGSTRYIIVLMTYSGVHAEFNCVSSFIIPHVYELFSAMTQDELRGGLVRICTEGHYNQIGIYLSDKNTGKAICIDTRMSFHRQCVPQALLSSTHLVLYWDALDVAKTFMYEMDILRTFLAREGSQLGDQRLLVPVILSQSNPREFPFRNVNPSKSHEIPAWYRGSEATAERILDADFPEARHGYPIIVPKWHTLGEDLKRHRTRSMLCLSRHVRNPPDIGGLNAGINADAAGANGSNSDAAATPNDTVHDATHSNDEDLRHDGGMETSETRILGTGRRTTITHHYFDYVGSSSSETKEIVRTVLADVRLRRPQNVFIEPHVRGDIEVYDPNAEIEENGVYHFNGEELVGLDEEGLSQEDLIEAGPELEGMGVVHSDDEDHEGYYEPEEIPEEVHPHFFHMHAAVDEIYDQLDNAHVHNNEPHDDDDTTNYEMATLAHNPEGLGLEFGDDQEDAHAHIHGHEHNYYYNHGSVLHITQQAVQALADIFQDPFGGSPVMGYGGRCAMWVEEAPRRFREGGREPVLRLVTLPTYQPTSEADKETAQVVHPELEVSAGRVVTLYLPDYVDLARSYTFDLDDIRGIVGIATLHGDLWLMDFS